VSKKKDLTEFEYSVKEIEKEFIEVHKILKGLSTCLKRLEEKISLRRSQDTPD